MTCLTSILIKIPKNESWIVSKDMSFFQHGILLPERWEKVVASDEQYFE